MELASGGLMLVIGLGVAYHGMDYDMGTLRNMGPGFFPVALGVLLAIVGVLIAVGEKVPAAARVHMHANAPRKQALKPEWRGWICICLGVASFVVLGSHGGLLPASFSIVFISALGDRDNSIRDAALFALGMAVLAAVVFHWGLSVQFPLLQWGWA
jgi:hypothetical protein